jgi:hypothetical protein
MGEVLFILGMIGGLVLPFVFLTGKGRWYWLIMMTVIGLILGATEIIAVVDTGATISQHFWDWSVKHPTTAWIVLAMLFGGWMVLLVHLAWKLMTNKNYRNKKLNQ